MSIQRTDISGDIALLKAALETLVPDFFASVEYDDAESPTIVVCKDADENTIFTTRLISGTSANCTYTAYKDATTSIAASGSPSIASPLYFYKVGDSNAAIQCPNSMLIVISKTNTSGVGFVIPDTFVYSNNTRFSKNGVACWGDDPTLNSPLTITGTHGGSNADEMVGNHTLFVPIPMHGTYAEQVYLPKAFFMPMAQTGMRGIVQELSADEGTYLTNGYVALLDD